MFKHVLVARYEIDNYSLLLILGKIIDSSVETRLVKMQNASKWKWNDMMIKLHCIKIAIQNLTAQPCNDRLTLYHTAAPIGKQEDNVVKTCSSKSIMITMMIGWWWWWPDRHFWWISWCYCRFSGLSLEKRKYEWKVLQANHYMMGFMMIKLENILSSSLVIFLRGLYYGSSEAPLIRTKTCGCGHLL